jgi:hypothetical protein
MDRRLRIYAAAAAWLGCVSMSYANPRPAVLELFTSQGCNSCPPADRYLGQLSGRPDVVALAFHVDYWDSLGWRDRFALAQSVERQNTYAHNLHRASVYTPQLVIDGRVDAVGSDRQRIESALGEPRSGVAVAVAVRDAEVHVNLPAVASSPDCEVVAISYLRHAVSPIGRGENAGHTLDEFNIVRSVRVLGRWAGESRAFAIPVGSLPSDATDLAVLVQTVGQGSIVGAAVHSLR